jgi:hypothetical protein
MEPLQNILNSINAYPGIRLVKVLWLALQLVDFASNNQPVSLEAGFQPLRELLIMTHPIEEQSARGSATPDRDHQMAEHKGEAP